VGIENSALQAGAATRRKSSGVVDPGVIGKTPRRRGSTVLTEVRGRSGKESEAEDAYLRDLCGLVDRPVLGLDPIDEHVSGLAMGFGEEDCAFGGEVAFPELLQKVPLGFFVDDVGAEDEVEALVEVVGLPIDSADARGEGEGVETGEEEGGGFEIDEGDVGAHGGGGGAGEAHAAAQV